MNLSSLARAAGASALVVKRFEIDEQGPVHVEIEGRKKGLVSWLLGLLGLDDTTTLKVYATHAELSSGSLAGRFKEVVPLSGVCNLGTGYLKPISNLIAAIGFLAFFVASVAIGRGLYGICWLVAAAISVFAYFFNKAIMLYIAPKSGSVLAIAFKRSFIEGKNIDEETAKQIIAIVKRLAEVETHRSV